MFLGWGSGHQDSGVTLDIQLDCYGVRNALWSKGIYFLFMVGVCALHFPYKVLMERIAVPVRAYRARG